MSNTIRGSNSVSLSVLGLLIALLSAMAGCGAPIDLSAEQTGRTRASVTRSVEVIQPRDESAPLRVVIDGQNTTANVMCGAPGVDGRTLCWVFAGGASFSVREVAVMDGAGGWTLRSDARVAAESDLQRTLAPEIVASSLAPVKTPEIAVDFHSVARVGIGLDGIEKLTAVRAFEVLNGESETSHALAVTNLRPDTLVRSAADSVIQLSGGRPNLAALLGYESIPLVNPFAIGNATGARSIGSL